MENSLTEDGEKKEKKKKGPPHVFQVKLISLEKTLSFLVYVGFSKHCFLKLTVSFQALQYLRKVCNHPALVLTPSHPEYERISTHLKLQSTSLHDINNASKLVALR